MQCPGCAIPDPELECRLCGGSGELVLRRCPYATVPLRIWHVAEAIEFFLETHVPPAAGGLCDQSCTFLEALRIVAPIRADLMSKQHERSGG